MISTEIALFIVFTLLGTAIFLVYRYFSAVIHELTRCIDYHEENGRFALKCEKEAINKRIDLLEHKLKDGLQSNATCSRSSLEKIYARLDLLDKNTRGSVNVVIPEIKNKSKKQDNVDGK